jgi:hypothetical protein
MTGNAPPPAGPRATQSLPDRDRISGQRTITGHRAAPVEFSPLDGVEKLFARSELQVPDFTTISLRLPNPPADTLTFSIDRGNGGRPDLRSQLTLDRSTGEAGGLLGQTVAAIASAGAALLVFTGLSLGLRRFLAWKERREKVLATTGS